MTSTFARADLVEPPKTAGLPQHRAIVALDIEQSTCRPDPVKAELRSTIYRLFDEALCSAGIHKRHRDRFTDRGDGLLALIHPVNQAPKPVLLNRVVPALTRLLTDYNADIPPTAHPQRLLRVRCVVHAGEVHYDRNGCFGEALDISFRLLDAHGVKKALRAVASPLILVISGDIYRTVVRHGYDGIDQDTFRPLVRARVAGNCYTGWIHIPQEAVTAERHRRHLAARCACSGLARSGGADPATRRGTRLAPEAGQALHAAQPEHGDRGHVRQPDRV